MTDEEIDRIQFEWIFACVIIAHCRARIAKQKIAQCCAQLTKRGVLRRVSRGRYEAVQKPKATT